MQLPIDRLSKDEQIIAVTFMEGIPCYATNKRLIAYKGSEESEAAYYGCLYGILGSIFYWLTHREYFRDIEYSRISDITVKKYRPRLLVIAGIIITLVCLILFILSFVSPEVATPIRWVALISGIVMIGLVCFVKPAFYQIEGPDLSEEETRKWRFVRHRRSTEFIEAVQKEMNSRQSNTGMTGV